LISIVHEPLDAAKVALKIVVGFKDIEKLLLIFIIVLKVFVLIYLAIFLI
jgi:hypothetical protein